MSVFGRRRTDAFRKVFRGLIEIISPPKETARVFDLTDSEIRALRELRSLDEWGVWLKCLDSQSTLYGEAMLAAQSVEKMWEMRGYILGLRRAGLLVDEILQKEKEKESNDERRRSNIRSNDHRDTALYGTASWGVS